MHLKHAFTLSIFVLIASSLLVNARLAEDDPSFISWIPKVSTPPVIDGEIDELWHAQAAFLINFVQSGTVEDEADFSAEWFGLYDDSNFYFIIDIHDQFLESEAGADIWRNDRIEVYFNMDNVKPGGNGHSGDNYQYAFHWNKPEEQYVNNGSWDGVEWAQTTTDYGYTVEVKIPFATLTTLDAIPGFSFGFDIAINDNDGFPTYDSVNYWWCSNGTAEWSNIDGAGTVGLGELFDGNYAPIIAEVERQTALEGTASSINLSATDSNAGDAITFSVPNLPAFASLQDNGNGTAEITVNAQPGDANIYFLDVIASDGTAEGIMEIILVVRDPNVLTQPPEFDPLADTSVKQSSLLLVDVSATDKDSLNLEFTGVDLPAFATVIDNGDKTATIELNPGFDITPQSYTITLQVKDLDENTDSISFQVEVQETIKLTEFHCDPVTGDIQNDGSPDSPWSTLEAVFAAGKLFAAGDVIYLHDGYHGEPEITGENSDFVFIMPAAGAIPTLSRVSFSSQSSYWDVGGLDISRTYAPEFTIQTMAQIAGNHNILRDSNIFTVPDISSFTLDELLTKIAHGVSIGGTDNLLEGCTVKNIRMGISVGGSFHTVRGNHVQYFTGDGMRGLGNDLTFEYNYVADNYNIDDNHDDGFQSWSVGDSGVGSGVVYRMTLRGNTIIQSTDPDLPWPGPLQAIGCFDGMFEDWTVENNVVIVNMYHGIALYGAINCRIINNTVLDSDLFTEPSATWILLNRHKKWANATTDEDKTYYEGRDNVVKNNLTTKLSVNSASTTVENNIELTHSDFVNYFVDYPYDVHLRSGSPAIDAGDPSVAPEMDADGNLRALDGNWDGVAVVDIGAYELITPNDWINHPELGWLHTGHATDPDDMWLYSTYLNGWAWSSQELFPILYDWNNSRYVYYMIFEDVGVWFFDYSTMQWTLNP